VWERGWRDRRRLTSAILRRRGAPPLPAKKPRKDRRAWEHLSIKLCDSYLSDAELLDISHHTRGRSDSRIWWRWPIAGDEVGAVDRESANAPGVPHRSAAGRRRIRAGLSRAARRSVRGRPRHRLRQSEHADRWLAAGSVLRSAAGRTSARHSRVRRVPAD